MNEERIRWRFADGIAEVEMNRPQKRNALDIAMFEALAAVQQELRETAGLRCVVLRGAGDAFCAGIDLSLLGQPEELLARMDDRGEDGANLFQGAAWGWRSVPVPVIAAVHGVAFGGGCQVMLGADIRIAAPDARIGILEAKWGLVPDMAGFPLLRQCIRDDIARELVYTARIVSGTEAAVIGLVTRTAEDPWGEALQTARSLADRPSGPLMAAKKLFNAGFQASDRQIMMEETRTQVALIRTIQP